MAISMLVSRDAALIETVLAAAAAAQVGVVVARDTETLRRNWVSAPIVLVGADMAATVVGLGLPARRGVHLCGPEAAALLSWSVPLDAPVMVLPDQTGFVSSLLVGRDELGAGGATLLRVVGGSGGVGATTLACGLAQRGHRQGLQVALVELDPCGGGIDLVFGAEQAKGWRWPDLASAAGHIGDLHGQLPNVSGVDLVSTGRSRTSNQQRSPASAGLPQAEAVQAVLASLSRSHDLVVLDAGAHPDPGVGTHNAQTLVVVAAEVKAVVATRLKVAAQTLDGAMAVVRTGPGRRLDAALVGETIGLPVLGVVPHDGSLPLALESGTPPGLGGRRFAKACDRLLDGLLGVEVAES
ncbi:MAG: hypothetical protein GX454_08320 [Brooklawnia sp.]|nr:hypothetical protein [Brooklawnia sp.]